MRHPIEPGGRRSEPARRDSIDVYRAPWHPVVPDRALRAPIRQEITAHPRVDQLDLVPHLVKRTPDRHAVECQLERADAALPGHLARSGRLDYVQPNSVQKQVQRLGARYERIFITQPEISLAQPIPAAVADAALPAAHLRRDVSERGSSTEDAIIQGKGMTAFHASSPRRVRQRGMISAATFKVSSKTLDASLCAAQYNLFAPTGTTQVTGLISAVVIA